MYAMSCPMPQCIHNYLVEEEEQSEQCTVYPMTLCHGAYRVYIIMLEKGRKVLAMYSIQ
jgi:hypothetical protein